MKPFSLARSFASGFGRGYSSAVNSYVPQLGSVKLPDIKNEVMYNYTPGSPERKALKAALKELRTSIEKSAFDIPCVVSGQPIQTGSLETQDVPYEHSLKICQFHNATKEVVESAIEKALAARPAWEAMPLNDRIAIFLKAADLLSTKYRYKVLAATMMGQGKNAWQAEIDAAAELADFWRFNCKFAKEIYENQPSEHFEHTWNRMEYRGLEGFVVAYSPFNFTAIGGNLVSAPALMGNVVLWKPSSSSIYSNYLILEILKEAGLPDGVIQFIPGDPELVTEVTFSHPEFAGFHFTGSTGVFKHLWKKMAQNLEIYKSYPRIVGETGGKDFHFIHESADVDLAVHQTIRGAFEYNGQKCSACSRVYVPDSLADEFQSRLKEELANVKMGAPEDFENFITAVINKRSYDKITSYLDDIKSGKNSSTAILSGGNYSDKVGYFIEPTVLVTKDPHSPTMKDELFGPVVTLYTYPAEDYEATLELAANSSAYALTGALFAQDRLAIIKGSNALANAAGNFYINDKCTGAIVGQQAFGGSRASGTNDKAGSYMNLLRWVSARTIKETFVPIHHWSYPSNLPQE